MKAYLLICYVDTQKISHNKKIVDKIVSIVNFSDIVFCNYTLLIKENYFQSIIENFKWDAHLFLNDPLKMYEDTHEDKSINNKDELFSENDANKDNSIFLYSDDYIPVYIQFVTATELFRSFIKCAKKFDIYNSGEYHIMTYSISSLDQMEILRVLQRPQTEISRMNKFIVSNTATKIYLLSQFVNSHLN